MSEFLLFAVAGVCLFAGVLFALNAAGVIAGRSQRGLSQSISHVKAATANDSALVVGLNAAPAQRLLGPLLAVCLRVGQRLTPPARIDHLASRIESAGMQGKWTVSNVVAAKGAGFGFGLIAGLAISALFAGPIPALIIVPALAAAGLFAPNMALHHKTHERNEAIQRGLPECLDLMLIALEAGQDLNAALRRVAVSGHGPMADEFRRVGDEMRAGAGQATALRNLAERSSVEDVRRFCASMVQATTLGASLGATLRVQAEEMRVKRTQRAEERAQKVAVKILFPLIFCILPSLFVIVLGPAMVGAVRQLTSS